MQDKIYIQVGNRKAPVYSTIYKNLGYARIGDKLWRYVDKCDLKAFGRIHPNRKSLLASVDSVAKENFFRKQNRSIDSIDTVIEMDDKRLSVQTKLIARTVSKLGFELVVFHNKYPRTRFVSVKGDVNTLKASLLEIVRVLTKNGHHDAAKEIADQVRGMKIETVNDETVAVFFYAPIDNYDSKNPVLKRRVK